MEKETHSPEISFFGMKALCELLGWPATPSVFVQGREGGPWSRALCLPARIPGSRVGVAGEVHHYAPGCFASEVKRAPQMSRHCHSSNLSPQELQRWATGGPSWCAEFAAYVYFKSQALAVLCFKTQFEILVLPVCLCLKVPYQISAKIHF